MNVADVVGHRTERAREFRERREPARGAPVRRRVVRHDPETLITSVVQQYAERVEDIT